MPSAAAVSAETGSPVSIIAKAASGPIRRGRRCVPPAPGMIPSLISGRPIRADGAATRPWQAIASSRPPPRAAPPIAATTGFGLASSRSRMSGRLGGRCGLPNSPISAPPTNTLPSAARTTARTDASAMAFVRASSRAARSAAPSALTGGLASVSTATPPSTS
jgi:hypothetical protein